MSADASAGRLAHDLGWTPACARSGTRPACRLMPAIQFIGYDGYPSHGSPRTCSGGCPAHLHLSWASPCYGTTNLSAPCDWLMAFTVLPAEFPARPAAALLTSAQAVRDSRRAARIERRLAPASVTRTGTARRVQRVAPGAMGARADSAPLPRRTAARA